MSEPRVTITSYSVPVPEPKSKKLLINETEATPARTSVQESKTTAQVECPAILANYLASRSPKGLVVYECHCQAHVWALPWFDKMAAWVSHQISPLKSFLETRGIKPEMPTPSQHVVLASPEDAHLLKMRRWRALPTKKGHRAKWFLQAGRKGLPLQRFIHPSAECITFENGDGLDLRRENLRRTTLKKLLRERNKRQGWAKRAARKAEKKTAQEKVAA